MILPFNPKTPTLMHIDLNSCFATIEQQANPLFRGRPLAVAAYTTPSGCIIASSVEAKKLGIKVGLRVKEGRLLCPNLIVVPPDPNKYRHVHQHLKILLSDYTSDVVPKSIDEFSLNFEGYPSLSRGLDVVGQEIKNRIKLEIGDWLTVSVGIAPNRYLAKIASNLHKPDGLDIIDHTNYQAVFSNLSLTDLTGIKRANASRLNSQNIYTVADFYQAPISTLRTAFHSIIGYYWHLRLHGWEIDDVISTRKSFGAMYSLPNHFSRIDDLSPILHQLVIKTGLRLRRFGFSARGFHLSVLYQGGTFWHRSFTTDGYFFDNRDLYRQFFRILSHSSYRLPVSNLSISLFDLQKNNSHQLNFFERVDKKVSLSASVDQIINRWGDWIITPATLLRSQNLIADRIGFGNIRDLENFITSSPSQK